MILPTLIASIVSLSILFLLFRNKLKEPFKIEKIEYSKPNKVLTIIGLIHLLGCIVLIAISNYINLEMWSITLAFCISLIVCYLIFKLINKNKDKHLVKTLKRAPWSLVPFVLSMFVIVLSLKENGYISKLTSFLNNNMFAYGYSGALTANLINNIPMSVLYSEALVGESIKCVYASIISSNIAAFISPFGALAGIMWLSLLKTYDIKYSFIQFIKYGLIVGIPTLSVALVSLYLL